MGNRRRAEPRGRRASVRRSGFGPADPVRYLRLTALVVVAGAYAWWVSSTTPFTEAADTAVAVGFALLAIPAAVSLLQHNVRRGVGSDGSGSSSEPLAIAGDQPKLQVWMAAIVAIAVYELFTYVAGIVGTRHAFPTLSSLYDTAASSQLAKALFVFAWMALGWGLFHCKAIGTEPGKAPFR